MTILLKVNCPLNGHPHFVSLQVCFSAKMGLAITWEPWRCALTDTADMTRVSCSAFQWSGDVKGHLMLKTIKVRPV